MPLRLKLLVVVHVLLSVLGIAQFRLLLNVLWLPAATAISSLAIAQSMLLGFWIGLGTSRLWQRCVAWILSSLYLGMWPALAILWLPPEASTDDASFFNGFVPATVTFALTTAVFAAIFLVIRWRFAVLRRAQEVSETLQRPQYAIIHVLVMTTVFSLILASSRAALTTEANSLWHLLALYALMLTTFVSIMVAATWAILQPGPVWRRTLIVLLCSFAAGTAVSFAFYYRLQSVDSRQWWWIFLGQATAIGLVPTLILVASLAIVRGSGFRLVNKRSLVAAQPLQFTSGPLNSRTATEG
jgi:hypothetical protein